MGDILNRSRVNRTMLNNEIMPPRYKEYPSSFSFSTPPKYKEFPSKSLYYQKLLMW